MGHILTGVLRCIDPDRVQGILQVPLPQTKHKLRQFLGLVGYCRAWIEDFSVVARPLYDFLTKDSPDVIVWTPEREQSLKKLKDKLIKAPVLALPDSEKEFELFVDVKQGHAKGILVQENGGTRRPVAYFSKLLEPVARGWPHCLKNCAATAQRVAEARKLTRGGYFIVKVSHQIKALFTERASKWMTSPRLLQYESCLMEKDNLELKVGKGSIQPPV